MATDQITTEALDTLRTAVTTLVPPIAGGAVRRAVVVTPLRVKAVGLGGHVGTEEVVINNAPLTRELPVRRVEAQVGVVIRADTEAEAEAGAAAAGTLLLAADRRQLRELGLLRLAAQAPVSALAPPPAPSPPFVRELIFK